MDAEHERNKLITQHDEVRLDREVAIWSLNPVMRRNRSRSVRESAPSLVAADVFENRVAEDQVEALIGEARRRIARVSENDGRTDALVPTGGLRVENDGSRPDEPEMPTARGVPPRSRTDISERPVNVSTNCCHRRCRIVPTKAPRLSGSTITQAELVRFWHPFDRKGPCRLPQHDRTASRPSTGDRPDAGRRQLEPAADVRRTVSESAV